jgi:excinuclease ABC subunit C
MIHEVSSILWKETDSVLEAIILEANEIKKRQPKYNVEGKDDKSWNYIVVTADPYPRVLTVRAHDAATRGFPKKAKIFGPYPGLNTAATMKILRKLFRYSTCSPGQKRPCLYYQMGECLGVCAGAISPAAYRAAAIRPLITFLSGRKKHLLARLKTNMRRAAAAHRFEEAARLRNQICALGRIQDIALLNKTFVEDAAAPSADAFGARVEGYDISNLGPTGMVGSMVVFGRGAPDKNAYRKFKIRAVTGQSDVDCLEEVLRRRLKHTEWPYPRIFLIDGGLPQVNRAKAVLKSLKLSIPIVGLAKGPDRKKNEIVLGTDDADAVRWIYANTRTLIAVRDEAHRFAIAYQRALRRVY